MEWLRGVLIRMVAAGEEAQKVDKPDVNAQVFQRRWQPQEIAAVVAFLLSDESTFVTGAIWSADRGWNCEGVWTAD